MKAVILAGGRGTRLDALGLDVPKPLAPVCGVPILARQLDALAKDGVRDIIIVTGYRAGQIEDYVGSGEERGVNVSYFREETPMGTGGALYRLGLDEDFLVLGGDLLFDIDISAMLAFHKEHGAAATLFAHPVDHPFDCTLIRADADSRVLSFIPKERRGGDYANLCNAGIQILSPALLETDDAPPYADLDRDIIYSAVNTGRVFAYKSYEYVKDMGTPARLSEAENALKLGMPARKRRSVPQKAVFLDRDGTLNVHKGYISRKGDLELLPGAGEAVRTINRKGYLAVLVTNQPVVARGLCTEAELDSIHCRLETMLGDKGAYLDGIYVCPHHPDSGFPGEVRSLKIDCDCRKPKPGLILRAARELNIDIPESYMVGDSMRDVQAARNAGCRPALLSQEPSSGAECPCYPDLYSFAEALN